MYKEKSTQINPELEREREVCWVAKISAEVEYDLKKVLRFCKEKPTQINPKLESRLKKEKSMPSSHGRLNTKWEELGFQSDNLSKSVIQ